MHEECHRYNPPVMRNHNTASAARAACLALALCGCAVNPVTQRSDFVLMSEEQEIALGARSHGQIMRQYRAYDDAALQAVVTRIGRQLAAVSHRSHLDFHFTVLDSPEVNAFALPGGHIYITRGIIAYMNSLEELAGVLGHEIGHVTARHGVRQHAASAAAGFLGALITAAAGDNEAAGDVTDMLGGALISGYGRKHELEADRLGAEYLARGGYEPRKMLEVIGILKDREEFEKARAREEGREPSNYHGIFSTHPDNDRRLREVVAAADRHKREGVKPADRARFLRLLEGVTFGESERDGITRGRRFYHRELDLFAEFPAEWRIHNLPAQLRAVRADNRAALFIEIKERNGGDARRHLLREYPGIREVRALGRGRHAGVITANTAFGKIPAQIAAVAHGDGTLFVAGFAEDGIPKREVLNTAKSLRRLKAGERKLAKARRIRIVRAAGGRRFADYARGAGLGAHGADQLRLLNGVYPNGEPAAGKLIKIIR